MIAETAAIASRGASARSAAFSRHPRLRDGRDPSSVARSRGRTDPCGGSERTAKVSDALQRQIAKARSIGRVDAIRSPASSRSPIAVPGPIESQSPA